MCQAFQRFTDYINCYLKLNNYFHFYLYIPQNYLYSSCRNRGILTQLVAKITKSISLSRYCIACMWKLSLRTSIKFLKNTQGNLYHFSLSIAHIIKMLGTFKNHRYTIKIYIYHTIKCARSTSYELPFTDNPSWTFLTKYCTFRWACRALCGLQYKQRCKNFFSPGC